ncbi:MAG: hypothetical protein JWM58_3861 [Rhizobium sp.]|nr:hypothetical protein [Rhizobium sp.]
MFFVISKLVEQFLLPSNFLMLAGVLGVVLLILHRRKLGTFLSAASIVLLAIGGWAPIGTLALAPLENRFPRPDIIQPPTGIIMLGGAVDTHLTGDRKMVTMNDAGERLTETAALGYRFPQARIFLSGGLGHIGKDETDPSESAVAKEFLLEVGIPAERISMEEISRTTCENALESAKALNPKPNETWLLVTSAWHMPRAVACFRSAKFAVTPYPVDFHTSGTESGRMVNKSVVFGLGDLDLATHEWIGLVAYWLTGKTTQILPS